MLVPEAERANSFWQAGALAHNKNAAPRKIAWFDLLFRIGSRSGFY
jgi:hypothetical protein